MTWLIWLHRHARVTDDPAGDLVQDMRVDRAIMGQEFRSAAELCLYLRFKQACPEAIVTAPVVWRRYLAWRDR